MIHIIFNEADKNKAPYSKNGNSLFYRINDNRTCDNYPEINKERKNGILLCNCIKTRR